MLPQEISWLINISIVKSGLGVVTPPFYPQLENVTTYIFIMYKQIYK